MNDFPSASKSQLDRAWLEDCSIVVERLRYAENKFVQARDEALAAGAEPLLLDYNRDRLEFPEFAGTHPSDGWSNTQGTNMRNHDRVYTEKVLGPQVERWLDNAHRYTNMDPEQFLAPDRLVDEKNFAHLKAASIEGLGAAPSPDAEEATSFETDLARASSIGRKLDPWDSVSSRENTTFNRGRIDSYRQIEHP